MAEIRLTWIGERPEPPGLLPATAARLGRAMAVSVAVTPAPGRPAGVLDTRRGQHSSTAILHWLEASVAGEGRVLGVTDADLFMPVLTFVYGEARLGGRTAVVSLARLQAGRSTEATVTRLAKEVVHETGHLYGLVHCADARCVMRRSASLRDVDAKGGELCHDCRARLEEARGAERTEEAAT